MEKMDHLDAKRKNSSASKLQNSLKQEVCSWSSCDLHAQVLKDSLSYISFGLNILTEWMVSLHYLFRVAWKHWTTLYGIHIPFSSMVLSPQINIGIDMSLCGPKPTSCSLKIRSFWSDIIHPSLVTSDRQYWVVNIQCMSSVDCRLVQIFSLSVSPASSVLIYYFVFMTFDVYALQILQLETRLRDQFAERRVLEKALGYGSSSHDNSNEILMPKVDSFLFLRLHFSTRIMQT